jgi:mannitol-1-phosphate 5-dehydrogenase
MYGAGSIGRGFIGPLFAHAGYDVVFVDVNLRIIDALNSRRGYRYTLAANPAYDRIVNGVYGVDGLDEQKVCDEIVCCDIMATALGPAVLQKVSPLIAKGFSQRMTQSGCPLNLIICENLKDSAGLLRRWLSDALPDDMKELLYSKCGLIEAAVGRMVPGAEISDDDPLHLTVEEYGFLPVNKDGFVGKPPKVQGLILASPFAFYEDRKLYLHNMGHAICAYLGMMEGCQTIAEAIMRSNIRYAVQGAMIEAAAMISAKYKVPFARIYDHAEDLLLRFQNTSLSDTCARVGRDPIRKIKAGERLAGALTQCGDFGVHNAYIALGYAAALWQLTYDPVKAAEIAVQTGELGPRQAEIITELYKVLGDQPEKYVQTAERLKKQMRGNTV